jgi:DNA-binding NtrC family response regulator
MALTAERGRYSILIADDDEQWREALRDIVAPEGFQALLAEDGEQAVDIVQRRPVHLLVCDMYMPRLTGLETLQLVRQINAFLPCILISGDVDERLIRDALLAKAYSVLTKPVSKNIFIYTVVRALNKFYEQDRTDDELLH